MEPGAQSLRINRNRWFTVKIRRRASEKCGSPPREPPENPDVRRDVKEVKVEEGQDVVQARARRAHTPDQPQRTSEGSTQKPPVPDVSANKVTKAVVGQQLQRNCRCSVNP